MTYPKEKERSLSWQTTSEVKNAHITHSDDVEMMKMAHHGRLRKKEESSWNDMQVGSVWISI